MAMFRAFMLVEVEADTQEEAVELIQDGEGSVVDVWQVLSVVLGQ